MFERVPLFSHAVSARSALSGVGSAAQAGLNDGGPAVLVVLLCVRGQDGCECVVRLSDARSPVAGLIAARRLLRGPLFSKIRMIKYLICT